MDSWILPFPGGIAKDLAVVQCCLRSETIDPALRKIWWLTCLWTLASLLPSELHMQMLPLSEARWHVHTGLLSTSLNLEPFNFHFLDTIRYDKFAASHCHSSPWSDLITKSLQETILIMAVMTDLPGVEVTIQVDEVALKEYEDEDEDNPEKTHIRYVEAVSGKEFKIIVKLEKGFRLQGDSFSCNIYADGRWASTKVLEPLQSDGVSTKARQTVILGFNDFRQITKFRFADLETGNSMQLIVDTRH